MCNLRFWYMGYMLTIDNVSVDGIAGEGGTGVNNCEMIIAEPIRIAPQYWHNLVLRFAVALTAGR